MPSRRAEGSAAPAGFHRLRRHQCAQEEPAAPTGIVSLASDAVAEPCRRTGGVHRSHCLRCAQDEPAALAYFISLASDAFAALPSRRMSYWPCRHQCTQEEPAALAGIIFRAVRATQWQRHAIAPDVSTDTLPSMCTGRASCTRRFYSFCELCGGSAIPSCRMGSPAMLPSMCTGRVSSTCRLYISSELRGRGAMPSSRM